MARDCPQKKRQNRPQQKSGFRKSNKHQDQQMKRFHALQQSAQLRVIDDDSEDDSDLDSDEDDSVETLTDIPSIAERTARFTEEEREQWVKEMKNQGINF
jgi:hypothetical protein